MVRHVLKWCDEKFEDIQSREDMCSPKHLAMAFGIGGVEGIINALCVGGLVVTATGVGKAIADHYCKK